MNKINLSLILFVCFFVILAEADDHEPDLVEVHYPESPSSSYKERRKSLGFTFAITQNKFIPRQYVSLIDNVEYADIFGEKFIPMNQAELGIKWNHQLGSLAINAVYGLGQVSGNYIGIDKTLNLKKNSAELTLAFDNLFEEPYVVPYGSFTGSTYSIEERDNLGSIYKTTNIVYGYRAGLLFQLNWIDSEAAQAGRLGAGFKILSLIFIFVKMGPCQTKLTPMFFQI